ncbi:AfsA-related hotdog domain-containing protein [Nonomuraea recticatena]
MELYRGSRHAGTARARARCTSPAVLARLRGGQAKRFGQPFAPGPPVPAESVGKAHAEDVILAATGDAEVWTLRCRPHPVLFDHPMDHVPGNLMIEAMLQATRSRHWPRRVGVRALSANFHSYADLDRLVTVRAADPIGDDEPILVSLTQDGEHLADGLITTTPLN